MRKFGLFISKILILFFLISTVLDLGYTFLFTKIANTSKFHYIKNQKGKHFDYIFLGSSRVVNTIDTRVIDSCLNVNSVNFGVMDAKPKDILTILKLIKFYNIKCDSIFIQTDYYYNSTARSNFLYVDMLPFIREDVVMKNYYKEEKYFLFLYYFPFYRFSNSDSKLGLRELIASLKRSNEFEKNKGYIPLDGFGHQWQRILPDTIAKNNKYNELMLTFLNSNKIKYKFFTAPFRNDTKNMEFTQLLIEKYPGLWDFSKSIPDDTKFKNGYHLNKQGAEEFSVIISNKIKSQQ